MQDAASSAIHSKIETTWLAKIHVTLKPVVLDPQGSAVLGGLHTLDFGSVSAVRVGKYLEVTLSAPDQTSAQEAVQQMCSKLLANPVIEQYRFELDMISQ
ncbi:MAG TPA: phosphoribosylformylglycinamidine synthase subunit PurS [Ktedonobacterales bacterium]